MKYYYLSTEAFIHICVIRVKQLKMISQHEASNIFYGLHMFSLCSDNAQPDKPEVNVFKPPPGETGREIQF